MNARLILLCGLGLTLGLLIWRWRADRVQTFPPAGEPELSVADPRPAESAAERELRRDLTLAQARIRDLEHSVRDLEARLSALEQGAVSARQPKLVELVNVLPPEEEPDENRQRGWGPEQATGAPDTFQAGDLPTAWAPATQDGGDEWLQLNYAREVSIAQVRVRETCGPGAVSKLSAVFADGSELVLWEGLEPASSAPVEMEFTPDVTVMAGAIRVYLDTTRVKGWNEIDAVELVGLDGSRQWATSASASSSYAERTQAALELRRAALEQFQSTSP